MQVFIVGSPLETAMALDPRRLNKQIIECQQILDALNGAKAWSNHPCTLQYRSHKLWLELYMYCLESFQMSLDSKISPEDADGFIRLAMEWSEKSFEYKPPFHTQEYFDQMKKRLFTKNAVYYIQWANLGTSDVNWYFVDDEWRYYKNGKRVKESI